MGGHLSLHHAVSLSLWGNGISPTLVPKNIDPDAFLSSLDDVCWGPFRGFNPPSDFTSKLQKIII
jgi:hypothetical protein